MRHSPGPWRRGGVMKYIVDADGKRVAEVYRPSEHPCHDEACAGNARLIAAAPLLLTMLRRLYEATYGKTDLVCPLDFEHARKAIAKAEGREQQ